MQVSSILPASVRLNTHGPRPSHHHHVCTQPLGPSVGWLVGYKPISSTAWSSLIQYQRIVSYRFVGCRRVAVCVHCLSCRVVLQRRAKGDGGLIHFLALHYIFYIDSVFFVVFFSTTTKMDESLCESTAGGGGSGGASTRKES